MRAYELPIKITPDGKLEVPAALIELLPRDQTIRMILLVNEPADASDQTPWVRLTAEQFLAGYSESDAIYDRVD